MTDIVTPKVVRNASPAPLTSDPPQIFDDKCIALASWYQGFIDDLNQATDNTNQNALAAYEFADAAQLLWQQVEDGVITIQQAMAAIQAGPVVSVMGRSGVVTGLLDGRVETIYSKSSPMTAAPLWKWVAYTSLDGANADWPTAAPVSFWIVFTKGVSEAGNDRFEQTAEQVYTQGGQGFTFKRVKHDGTWSRWKRVLTDDNIVESDAGGAINTSTFLLDPSVASVQHKSLSANTTISLPAARGAGDQATLYLYQGGSFSFAFASNIFLPVGVTLEAIPSGQMLPLYFFPKYTGSNQWCVAPGTRYQG